MTIIQSLSYICPKIVRTNVRLLSVLVYRAFLQVYKYILPLYFFKRPVKFSFSLIFSLLLATFQSTDLKSYPQKTFFINIYLQLPCICYNVYERGHLSSLTELRVESTWLHDKPHLTLSYPKTCQSL